MKHSSFKLKNSSKKIDKIASRNSGKIIYKSFLPIDIGVTKKRTSERQLIDHIPIVAKGIDEKDVLNRLKEIDMTSTIQILQWKLQGVSDKEIERKLNNL